MRKRRILSLLLAVAVMATMLVAVPLTASATDNQWDAATDNTNKWIAEGSTETNGSLTVEVLPAKWKTASGDWGTGSDESDDKAGKWDYKAASSGSSSHPAYGVANDNMRAEKPNDTASDKKLPAYNALKVSVEEKGTLTFNILFGSDKKISVIKAAKGASTGEYVSGKYNGNDETFNNPSIGTGTGVFSDLSFEAEPGYYYYVGSTGTKAQYSTITFTPAETESKGWINNSGDKENSTVTEVDGEATLTYKANYTGNGFSYDLKSILTGGPVDLSSADGIVEVSAQMYLDSTQKAADDFFIDISGDIETSYKYRGASDATYGRIAGHGGYNFYRFIGGQNSTLGGKLIYEDGSAKVSDDWVTISYKINLKDKSVTIGHNGKEHIVSGFAKSVNDALYLNVAPTLGANSDNDVVIKFKDIKAEYKPAGSPEFDKENSKAVSGFYTDGNADPDSGDVTKYGIIRFLQGYTGSNVSEYGFYFVDGNGIILNAQNYVTSSAEFNPEENGGFYSDLTGIEEKNWGESYSAKAYVVIDGVPYFSDSISGTVGVENDNWVYAPSTEE